MNGIVVATNQYWPKALPPGKPSQFCAVFGAVQAIMLAMKLSQGQRWETLPIAMGCVTTLPPASLALINPRLGDLACVVGLVILAVSYVFILGFIAGAERP